MLVAGKKTVQLLLVLAGCLILFTALAQAGGAGSLTAPSTGITTVQYYPRYYPPGYYTPPTDPYEGTKGSPGSGWIVIEVDPQEAAVYIDGHKLKPEADNSYEEGVLAGRHKVEVKKGGYRDYVVFVDVPPGAKESLTVQLRKIK